MSGALWVAWALAANAQEPVEGVYRDATGREGAWVGWVPPEAPTGLLVWFHEDGGARRYRSVLRGPARRLAARHGLALLVPQEPDGGYWWAPRAADDARWAAGLLDERVAAWGVDPTRVILAGKSGGAAFAAGLPPRLGWRWGGGVVALCGADVPRDNGADTTADPPAWSDAPAPPDAVREGYVVRLVVGARDPLRALSEASAAWYRDQGFAHVTHELTPRPGHCAFPVGRELRRGVEAVLAAP